MSKYRDLALDRIEIFGKYKNAVFKGIILMRFLIYLTTSPYLRQWND